ncbi:DUF4422 domain-containing protein [Pelagibacteraceae bacterium]|nr:DUF4422 domain-containing protein [Pelagibacteraceae bacterium]
MYSLCLYPRHYSTIKKLNYIPVGLGKNKFDNNWLQDNTGENISKKNPYYGEYTFHYWLWKNQLSKIRNNTWIGFCGYRYFWKQEKNSDNSKSNILKTVPDEWHNYEAIVADPQYVNNIKLSKIFKNGAKSLLLDPKSYIKSRQNIHFHFKVFHGQNSLDKAIDLLDENNREPFRKYINNKVSFHKWNMFVCRSQKKLIEYYNSLFLWLDKCEDIFGFNLDGYGQKRMYGFLAERYLSYWFTKNTKFLSWPVFKLDIDQ